MEQVLLSDLVLNGIGGASGGNYNRVMIEGVGTVHGDVRAEEFRLNGLGTVHGDVAANEVSCDGKLKIEGRLSGRKMSVDGLATVYGPVKGEDILLNGFITVNGDVEAESLEAAGAATIAGLLNAGRVRIRMEGPVRIKDIGCETITVERGKPDVWQKLLRPVLRKWSPTLEAETIEGDRLDLSYTNAAVVRGGSVRIGPGCRIGKVEYRESLEVHPRAQIGEERKLI